MDSNDYTHVIIVTHAFIIVTRTSVRLYVFWAVRYWIWMVFADNVFQNFTEP